MAILPEDIVRAIENATGQGDNFIDVQCVEHTPTKQDILTTYQTQVIHTSTCTDRGFIDDKVVIQLLSETQTTIGRVGRRSKSNIIFEAIVKDPHCILAELKDEIKASSPTGAIQTMSDFAACSYAAGKSITQYIGEILQIINRAEETEAAAMLKQLRLTITTKILTGGKIKGKTQDEFFTRLHDCIAELKSRLIAKPEADNALAKEKTPAVAVVPQKDFYMIRQGVATNAFAELSITPDTRVRIDKITGYGYVKVGRVEFGFANFEVFENPKTSTRQLLDIVLLKFTTTGSKSPIVTISTEEYAQIRKLKDHKSAREQLLRDKEILSRIHMRWEEKRFHYKQIDKPIFSSTRIKTDGDVEFVFSTELYNVLIGYPLMPYPAYLPEINSHKNPNSYEFLHKISIHKNMNFGKANENIISVKTLLSVAPAIPSYARVVEAKGDRHVQQRIITPFERDMDALKPTIKWHYCHSNNEPLTDNELVNMDYKTFSKLMIYTEWEKYPDQTKRLERRATKIEQAKRKQKVTKNE